LTRNLKKIIKNLTRNLIVLCKNYAVNLARNLKPSAILIKFNQSFFVNLNLNQTAITFFCIVLVLNLNLLLLKRSEIYFKFLVSLCLVQP